ncbi:MAG: Spx/MgsR family RNA polymerase-binding regulatory protein [Ectothiorhodospiraceae bacterium]|nr:Spx/MgsR family RNA polymerase-binding regulatory protein [Ectothiorhodospiraceae bacterium]MCH8504527.1 Spx/MgsR family RNA polymerase-binding regulatory protein [Ectothiorhodospiraceae bacterium]
MTTLYGISNCDTCRKARAYLDSLDVEYRFHDLRKDGLERDLLERWLEKLGPDTLVNRRSTTWRGLGEDEKRRADGTGLPDLLLAHPTLVKRPILDTGDTCLAGFREETYRQALR